MQRFKKGDVYVVNSKFKTLETVQVKQVKGDQVECEILEGSPKWIGDKITLSASKSDFAAFVYNDYKETFADKAKKFFRGVIPYWPFAVLGAAVAGILFW